ncbi:MAG: curli assembly protein CsgF [Flavobacteriaceae bacterium]|nr:curli assembly protein CsgF [Flavobacteriaceae bacterium]
MKKNIIFFLFFLASSSWVILAQEFVYKPVNPAFGGEVFNYQWLLSSAEAQNFYEEVEEDVELTDLQEFNQNLNRQLLNRINQALLNSQVNIEDGLQPGVYNFGSLNVQVYQSTGGLVVEVLDINTGEQTQIIIPN